ncbi:MAG: DNA-3-methyladenine glycosylase family protein [Thermoplasmata archaeon]
MPRGSATYLTAPRLARFPRPDDPLEYSSRSVLLVGDGRRLLRVWGAPEAPWVLGVEPEGSRWRIEGPEIAPARLRAAARAFFSLDHPLEEFYRRVRLDPVLRGAERRFRGVRLPRDPHPYESLIHSIVGQQISVRAAAAIKLRLMERGSVRLEHDGLQIPHLPTPAEIRRLGVDGLRSVGLSAAKARAILSLADPATVARLGRTDWAARPLEAAREDLIELPGVGRWTAENVLLRSAGRTDVFVAGDLGLRVALDRYGAVPRTAPESDARAWAERWYPGWGSYATFYLWRRLTEERVHGSATGPRGGGADGSPPPGSANSRRG